MVMGSSIIAQIQLKSQIGRNLKVTMNLSTNRTKKVRLGRAQVSEGPGLQNDPSLRPSSNGN